MAQAGHCDFSRWHFPPDPGLDLDEDKGGFLEARFSGDAAFNDATFSGNAWFRGARFSGDAWFDGARFSGDAWFPGATFSGNAWFAGAKFSRDALFMRATFSGDAWFASATFSGNAWFVRATISGGAGFGGATFSGIAQFNRAIFSGNAQFNRAMFSGYAGFQDATFERTAYFDRTQFNADALWGGAHFTGDAGFNSARFDPGSNIVFDFPHRGHPFRRRRAGESAYRLAKQAAWARGDYTEAGRYHYAEQCAIEGRLMHEAGVGPRFHGLVRLLFGRVVFGYGEKVSHPLLLGLAVIVAWALVFGCIDGVVPDPKSAQTSLVWWQYGYFSVVTFTTLGYGDYQPRQGWPQVLAGVEAALGAALLATFVVCLTRKYMR